MKLFIVFLMFFVSSLSVFGQYPFEQYPAIQYKGYAHWKFWRSKKSDRIYFKKVLPDFFGNHDTLKIQLSGLETDFEGSLSYITISHNGNLLKKVNIKAYFPQIGVDSVFIADINGDSLQDVKIVIPHPSTGFGCNCWVVYLFQQPDHNFTIISFHDDIYPFAHNRLEHDLDGDGNFEIITQTLVGYEKHSYWVFNLFQYSNGKLINVNSKYNYPIMVQLLYRENYNITQKISRKNMKKFTLKIPDGYDKK